MNTLEIRTGDSPKPLGTPTFKEMLEVSRPQTKHSAEQQEPKEDDFFVEWQLVPSR